MPKSWWTQKFFPFALLKLTWFFGTPFFAQLPDWLEQKNPEVYNREVRVRLRTRIQKYLT